MKWYGLLIWLMLPSFALAQEGVAEWKINDAGSHINFSVAIEGSPSEGEFTKFTADIHFDPEKLDQSRVEIIIDLRHIEALYSDVADNLKRKDWFDVENTPTARFVGRQFKHLGGQDYLVKGDLTLRDVTRSEILYFTLTHYERQKAAITGRMKIDRLDYGVGQGGWSSLSSVAGQVFLDVVVSATGK